MRVAGRLGSFALAVAPPDVYTETEQPFVNMLNSTPGVEYGYPYSWSKEDKVFGTGCYPARCYLLKTATGKWNVKPSYYSGYEGLHQVSVEQAFEYFLSIGVQPTCPRE